MADKKETVKKKKSDPKFNKGQLMRSGRYKFRKDLISVLLDDDKQYTLKEVDKMVKDYEQREVK